MLNSYAIWEMIANESLACICCYCYLPGLWDQSMTKYLFHPLEYHEMISNLMISDRPAPISKSKWKNKDRKWDETKTKLSKHRDKNRNSFWNRKRHWISMCVICACMRCSFFFTLNKIKSKILMKLTLKIIQ